MAEVQITEPQVFEISTPTIPGLPAGILVDSPPGVSITTPIELQYTCPMATYCGASIPCSWGMSLPLALTIPFPVISFPPALNIPSFSFRLEVPPPIFVTCPAFPDSDWQENLDNSSSTDSGSTGTTRTRQETTQEKAKLTEADIETTQEFSR